MISFARKPYNVVYTDFHTGELVTVKRRPPAKDHEMLPTDIVELKTKKNDDWEEGGEYTVKHISHRQPNTIQLRNDAGDTTFVESFDLELVEEVAYREGKVTDEERRNRYLTWP